EKSSSRRHCQRRWRLLELFSGCLLCPPAEWRIRNPMFSTDFMERNIGDSELLRKMRHRLGPDEFVKFLTCEDSGHGHPYLQAVHRRRCDKGFLSNGLATRRHRRADVTVQTLLYEQTTVPRTEIVATI